MFPTTISDVRANPLYRERNAATNYSAFLRKIADPQVLLITIGKGELISLEYILEIRTPEVQLSAHRGPFGLRSRGEPHYSVKDNISAKHVWEGK